MIPRIPFTFESGKNLSPTKMNGNIGRMAVDLKSRRSRRFGRSSFKLPFSGLSNTSAASEFSFLIKMPKKYTITAVELVLYEAAGRSVTLSLSGAASGWRNLALDAAGATTRARIVSPYNVAVAANTEVTFTLAVTGGTPWTLDKCYAVVHFRTDRLGTTTLSEPSLDIAAGQSVTAAAVNGFFTSYETEVAADDAADDLDRVIVVAMRSVPAAIDASDEYFHIPAIGARFGTMDVVNTGAVGDNFTATLLDSGGGTVAAVTVNGSGSPPAKTQGTSVAHTQTGDPTDSADDYRVRITRAGAGTIPLGYAVFYLTS